MPKLKHKPTIDTWHISPPPDISSEVRELAKKEFRGIRNMVLVLVREALGTRKNGGSK
jgi:hypothetical protein